MGMIEAVERRDRLSGVTRPAAWLVDAFGGPRVPAGVRVNAQSVLGYPPVYACVNVLAKDIAQIPIKVYERTPAGNHPAPTHALWTLLHDRPNPEMPAYVFKQVKQAHVLLWGNAYAEIEFNKAGRPVALWPLLPDRTVVVRKDGAKWIRTRLPDDREVLIPSRRVLHIPGLGYDGMAGYSVMRLHAAGMSIGLAAQESAGRFYGNGMRPSGVLTHPGTLKEKAKQNLRESIEKLYDGLSNAHRIALLEEGLKWEQLSLNADDAQLLDSHKFEIETAARIFDVPLVRLHHIEKATSWGTGIEQFRIAYLTHSLDPWLVLWEQVINDALFAGRSRFFSEFDRRKFLQADSKARAEYYRGLWQMGALNTNDIRRFENLNPVEGGDRHFVPVNMIPLDNADLIGGSTEGGGRTLPPSGPDRDARVRTEALKRARARRSVAGRHRLQRAHARLFRAGFARLLRREAAEVRRALEFAFGDRASPGFAAALERLRARRPDVRADTESTDLFLERVGAFYEKHEAAALREFRPLVAAYGEAVQAEIAAETDTDAEVTPELGRFLATYAASMAARHIRISTGELRKIVEQAADDAEAESAIEARMAAWEDTRPRTAAGHESVRAGGAVAIAAYAVAGVPELFWRAVGESCPYCRRLDGLRVFTGEPFLQPGDTVEADGDDDEADAPPLEVTHITKHPPAHPNGCDCLVSSA